MTQNSINGEHICFLMIPIPGFVFYKYEIKKNEDMFKKDWR